MITTKKELDQVRDHCKGLVTKRAAVSAATAAIPFGLAGAGSDVANLMSLLPKINQKFGLDPKQIDTLDEQTKEQIALIAGKIGSAFIGKFVTEALVIAVLKRVGVQIVSKTAASYVPFIGSGIAATISFGMMKAVGNAHVEECYSLVAQLLKGDGMETA